MKVIDSCPETTVKKLIVADIKTGVVFQTSLGTVYIKTDDGKAVSLDTGVVYPANGFDHCTLELLPDAVIVKHPKKA